MIRPHIVNRRTDISHPDQTIRIGGASGFWGESVQAVDQLLEANLDVLVFDYLAEITMSIMARARSADPQKGYALDFVARVLQPNLRSIASKGVKVISNAGGVNPLACAQAIQKAIDTEGLSLKVAVVTGDDLLLRARQFATQGLTEMFSGEEFPDPDRVASVNAYLGAFPIAAALGAGADIVITGRNVDSAVTLGACLHHYGWLPSDLNQLAGASLAGSILECSTQATGGNFTDWETMADGIADLGYPIAEVFPDGSFEISKPPNTAGAVSTATVAEQLLYEIGDPQAYVLPDVTCDFSEVHISQLDKDRVYVSGARGGAPPECYKVSATWADGFRGGQLVFFYGEGASEKAKAYADAVLARCKRNLESLKLVLFSETCVETFGDESHYGAARKVQGSREVALKIAARHPEKEGIQVLLSNVIGLALAAPPGLCGFQAGRPKPSPVVRLFSFLIPKTEVKAEVAVAGEKIAFSDQPPWSIETTPVVRPQGPLSGQVDSLTTVPLVRLAWARSGDKGNKANIGIIARRPEYLKWIWTHLTEQRVAKRFSHFLEGPVERFLMPGPNAINYLLHNVLGGGGIASLRNDPQGKGYSQLLLDMEIPVPQDLLENS